MGRSTLKVREFIVAWLPCLIVLAIIPGIAVFKDDCSIRGEGSLVENSITNRGSVYVAGGSWSIKPAKYTYCNCKGVKNLGIEVMNLSSEQASFDMGDGSTIEVAAKSSMKHWYKVALEGSTIRIYIKKVGEGQVQSGLVLKVEREDST